MRSAEPAQHSILDSLLVPATASDSYSRALVASRRRALVRTISLPQPSNDTLQHNGGGSVHRVGDNGAASCSSLVKSLCAHNIHII